VAGLFEVGKAACLRAEFLAVSNMPVAGKAGVVVPIHFEYRLVVVVVCWLQEGTMKLLIMKE